MCGGLCRFPGGANSSSGRNYGGQEVRRRKVDCFMFVQMRNKVIHSFYCVGREFCWLHK
jgi:hypothetical protein